MWEGYDNGLRTPTASFAWEVFTAGLGFRVKGRCACDWFLAVPNCFREHACRDPKF